jgi:hypothetical protein
MQMTSVRPTFLLIGLTGIEDYMLLKMARERIALRGAAAVPAQRRLDEILKTVITNRDTVRALFRAKRRELLELLESL